MNQLLQGVDVYLIGIMGAGKSTIGKILARKLNYRFFDTDILIERVAGKKIADIFAAEGEEYFRDLETQILKEVSAYRSSAIATGGGIIQKPINWSYLRQGLIVWLDVDLEILKKRLSKDQNRPLAGKLESLLEKRYPLYSQADMHIKCSSNQTPKQVADSIIARIPAMIMNKK
ncbi:Shikimate kinase [Hyella patelloides LEGE 07179]|uniref:Shikimate kinase n=1 Tax=Hyella patelloides LEGE 07179 TaxID=945734 RepID=A0A563VJ22_9CYAN|nr:shikimate kinase [Hyella patelloides]VEP11345.1 Shikimate kinase [Hyella patelloides LEGE 07179]